MKHTLYLILTISAAVPAFAGDPVSSSGKGSAPAPSQSSSTGRWRFSAGAAWRSIGGVDWRSGSSYSAGLTVPSLVGQALNPGFGTAGPLSGYADREYDDGFVRQGSPTAATGDTWNWGYESAGQVSGDEISYRTAVGPSSEIIRAQTPATLNWGEGDIDGITPYLAADYLVDLKPGLAVGAHFSFLFTSFDSGNGGSNFTAFQERRDYANTTLVDSYGLDGSIPPEAPYQGSFGGPGMLIRNIPDNRTYERVQTGGERVDLFNSVQENLDIDLYTFSAGFQAEFQRGRLSARAGIGLALNIASLDAARAETLSVRRGPTTEVYREWRDHSSQSTLRPGIYISGEASCAINERTSVGVFGRHDWNHGIRGAVGPSTFHVDLDGWTAGVFVGWRW